MELKKVVGMALLGTVAVACGGESDDSSEGQHQKQPW